VPEDQWVFDTACPRCFGQCTEPGTEPGEHELCSVCRGLGTKNHLRCPPQLLDIEIRELMVYYVDWSDHGTYPGGGSTLEQPAQLIRVFQILKSEASKIMKDRARVARGPDG